MEKKLKKEKKVEGRRWVNTVIAYDKGECIKAER